MSNQIIDFETLHEMNREDWQAPNALTAFTHLASTVGVCHQWDAGKQFDALDVFGTMIELSNFDCACAHTQSVYNSSCKQARNRKDLQMFETMNPNSPYFSDYIDELEAYYPDEPMGFDFEDEDE